MTTEQKRTKEKELWDKFGVRITYKNKDIEPYDKNKIYFTEKVEKANALFARIGHPKDLIAKLNTNS